VVYTIHMSHSEKSTKILTNLRAENHSILANTLSQTWSLSVIQNSKNMCAHSPTSNIEDILLQAFEQELRETNYSNTHIQTILSDLEKHRIIQTSAHTEIVPPSRRTCIDWITSQGIPDHRPYIIGAFSGVPFSNKSRPGRIIYNEATYNFIPKTHQDALVFSTDVLEKTHDTYTLLPVELQSILPKPKSGEHFARWAAQCSSNVMSKILNRDVVSLDLNAVITNYIIDALDNTEHLVTQILCDPQITKKIHATLGDNLHFFYTPYETSKYHKQENLYYLDGYGFAGSHEKYPHDPATLQQELRNRKLCPATFLTFFILTFMNNFACIGSFVQIEYLHNFKEQLERSSIFNADIQKKISDAPLNHMITGMFPSKPNLHALDFVQKTLPGNPNENMGAYYQPIWSGDNYYTNKQT